MVYIPTYLVLDLYVPEFPVSPVQSWWVRELDLKEQEKVITESGGRLNDCHMHAVHKLL